MVRPSEPVAVETAWGPYRGLFRFAAGGMAEVWVGAKRGHAGFEKLVAVKRMLPTLDEERFVKMFLDEAQVAAHVNSPHVVSTLDLGRADDGSLYIVMELVRGASLAHLMTRARRAGRPLPVGVIVEILAQACRGLHDAHEACTPAGLPLEIVHRDVSPQNLLVDTAGVVRVTDFGVARAVERFSRTTTGEVRGKIGYFSPEQAEGLYVDRRTDVFALGVVAHEMVTGTRLFRADSAIRTLQNVLTAEIPRLDDHPEVAPELEAAILRALERDPETRWATARDFGEALVAASPRSGPDAVAELVTTLAEEHLEALEARIRETYVRGETVSDVLHEAAAPPVEEAPAPTTRPAARRSWLLLSATAVAAALGAGVVVLALSPDPPSDPAPSPAVEAPSAASPPGAEAPAGEPPATSPAATEPSATAPPRGDAASDVAEPPSVDAVDRPARRATGRRASPERRPPARTQPAAQAEEPREAPVADPPPAETPAPPARGSGVLFGADTFEADLGGGTR